MLVLISKIIGLPVVAQQLPEKIGVIEDWVLDADKGKVVAYKLKGLGKQRWLSTIDIVEYGEEAVFVNDPEAVQPLGDLVRVKQLVDQAVRLVKTPVENEQSKKLGLVKDCVIDGATNYLTKLVVAPALFDRMFEKEILVSRQNIIKITPQKVVVRYDTKAPVKGIEPEIIQ